MTQQPGHAGRLGRRERAMAYKRRRIVDAARDLFAERGVGGVTTQEISARVDVASGTLFRYATTKAELLIMVQNEKFTSAVTTGVVDSAKLQDDGASAVDAVMALLSPVIDCVREQPELIRRQVSAILPG